MGEESTNDNNGTSTYASNTTRQTTREKDESDIANIKQSIETIKGYIDQTRNIETLAQSLVNAMGAVNNTQNSNKLDTILELLQKKQSIKGTPYGSEFGDEESSSEYGDPTGGSEPSDTSGGGDGSGGEGSSSAATTVQPVDLEG